MTDHAMRPAHRYETSLDRVGLALGAGSLLGGIAATLLVVRGGQHDPLALITALAMGTLVVGVSVTAVAGPVWLVLHVAGMRRARHAAAVGAAAALAIFVGAQTYGFGMFDMPVTDGRTLAFRWASAVATSLVLAALAAAIGAVMWRIAYRRQR